ncbi:16S rRNA (cytidine(1402)-2'-O)-methyltransferase [Roseibium sp. CAU 1637]|uniref:Ribosomal RNA small subunit methyltransferase I n=1 Tax=Roseibium limicola TaxID=2816037 RepID=A0A939ERA5_9HYPH|nr:16S rRNA (cytidine(1402)-2'-O)-methyltransferase [Roseibium limicola]MBO0347234.1 16S rRNA (cytidine(1402)-2'-O)-methyltransferase [Roseibium limicola]
MTADPVSSARRYFIGEHAIQAPPLDPALYIVSTPIGNLRDITVRALETLACADVIACEDTRVTGILTQRYGLKAKLLPYHEHNADKQRPKLLSVLEDGGSIALVSDAGTPLISDPGYRLVRDVVAEGHKVIPIPGASALLAGLVGAGLPSDTIVFAGFLAQKDGQKRTRLKSLVETQGTLVFYESPRRLGATLAVMVEELGADREAAVARELTKRFETFERGTLGDLAELFSGDAPKGEIVILVGPPGEKPAASQDDIDSLLREALVDMPVSAAAKSVAKQTGGDRNEIYKRALMLKSGDED